MDDETEAMIGAKSKGQDHTNILLLGIGDGMKTDEKRMPSRFASSSGDPLQLG